MPTARKSLAHPVLGMVAVMVAMILTGCSTVAESSVIRPDANATIARSIAAAQKSGYTYQYAVIKDGVVTDAELRQAYVDDRACYDRAGMHTTGIDRVDTLQGYTYAIQPAIANDSCDQTFLLDIADVWQDLHYFTLNPRGRQLIDACFLKWNLSTGDAQSIYDYVDAAGSKRGVADSCFFEVAAELAGPEHIATVGY